MCGITGWIAWQDEVTQQADVLERMTNTLILRGPDAGGTWLSGHCALGHRRLAVMDPEGGAQPMVRTRSGNKDDDDKYVIVYNGELYNAPELRRELLARGYRFTTTCDTEVLLVAYIEWGAAAVEKFNGIFAFAIWHTVSETLFLARDRVGVKPLFISAQADTFIFGSEPKALLEHPAVSSDVDATGLAEVFANGPARTPGQGIFRDISELLPGQYALVNRQGGVQKHYYWQLTSHEHTDDLDTTAARIGELLHDTLERQLASDVPLGTLLSGGLDSSALTALAVKYYGVMGHSGQVPTFSVDYVDNDKNFQAHAFQPNSDAPWIERMVQELHTNHRDIQFDTPDIVSALADALIARDYPGMADVDSSLLLFCREIKKHATVAISGEAADEVFGGYPWFHREEALTAHTFPWALAGDLRASLLADDVRDWLQPQAYLAARYEDAVAEVPLLPGESEEGARMRRMSYLNITRFMPTLLDRKDRMSMGAGLEVRVPYCDHRLIEYVFNVPWQLKTAGMREKGILRRSLEGVLPHDVLYRKKSPYPKTHNPNYLTAVRDAFMQIVDEGTSPLLPLINVAKMKEIAASATASSNLPWFGQLMSGPQLFAYFIQVDLWLRHYNVHIV
jgi:asparagine synthase (glutamine-hydrolysing)